MPSVSAQNGARSSPIGAGKSISTGKPPAIGTNGAAGPPTADEMARWLAALVEPDQVAELRTPRAKFASRFFRGDQGRDMVKEARRRSGKAKATYFTLNPVRLPLGEGRKSAGDRDIIRRRLVLIDCDPRRPAEVSSTDEEKAASLAVALAVRDHLRAQGWPGPALCDSGNGYHLLYRVDLPVDDQDLVKRCLHALGDRFDTDAVQIDRSVYNPSRITKLYGSLVCKGDHTAERPHRYSRVVEMPGALQPVPPELLEALADSVLMAGPTPAAPGPAPTINGHRATRWSPEARAVAYLEKCDPAISGQHGHDKTFAVACKVGPGFDLPPDIALRLLREVYNPKCDPPWPDKDLEHKVRDAYAKEKRRGWLLEAERDGHAGNGRRAAAKAPSNDRAAGAPPAGDGSVGSVGPPPQECPEFEGPSRPITVALRPVPPFRPELLPVALRAWIADVSDRAQCSMEFPAVGAVVVLAAIVGRKVAIRPKQQDVWTVVPNLWGLAVGRPGVLKTYALEQAVAPLDRLAAEARERHDLALEDHKRELLVIEAKKDAAKKALHKAAAKPGASDAVLRELAGGATANAEITPPVERRYSTNDTTVPKLGELLSANSNGMLVYRDEVMGFLRTLDMQGHESDRAFYLEAWNGTGSFTYDRIGRGTVHIPAVCLSMLGGIQPGPLVSYLRRSTNGEGDDGLISRYQLAVYPDQDRPFKVVDRKPDVGAKNRAFDVYRTLDNLDPEAIGAEADDRGGIPFLHFSPDAQEYFYLWWEALEAKLRTSESPAIESHLSKYRSLMPSLALLLHLVDLVDTDPSRPIRKGPVSLAAARRAAEWCDFLEEHARRIYQSALDGDPEAAVHLSERIKQSLPSPFTYRQVVQKGWAGLSTTEDVKRAVGILEDRGWVKVVEEQAGPQGGRPSTQVWINPGLLGKGGAKTSKDIPPPAYRTYGTPDDPEALAERAAILEADAPEGAAGHRSRAG